ncbi:MAG: beta-propeller fold lactonase family protein, partial [Pseudobdellovibrionaceae bacterium]
TETASLSYPTGSKTHSSSFDEKRKILHVANLGENKVRFYQMTNQGPVEKGFYSVPSPRTVVFDSQFDRLYITTEALQSPGFVKVLSFSQNPQGDLQFQETSSHEIGLSGSDLQVSFKTRVLVTAVREKDRENIVALPLTASGEIDSSKTGLPFPIDQSEPRSLKLLADGQTLVLTPNHVGLDLVIYRLRFSSEGLPAELVWLAEAEAGDEGFLSNLAIDVFE